MNFGEKFPYALLTFSQSLSKLIVGHTFSQSLSKLVIGYTTPQSLPARPAPHQPHTPHTHTPHTHTNHTPTIHNPTTPPIPLLLRVDSDEMWQKPVGFWLMRHWNARERPRSGRPRSGAQTKVDEECFSESCRVCAVTVKVPTNLKIFPKTTQMVKKFPSNTTYHLMVTNFTEFHRISPDHPR